MSADTLWVEIGVHAAGQAWEPQMARPTVAEIEAAARNRNMTIGQLIDSLLITEINMQDGVREQYGGFKSTLGAFKTVELLDVVADMVPLNVEPECAPDEAAPMAGEDPTR